MAACKTAVSYPNFLVYLKKKLPSIIFFLFFCHSLYHVYTDQSTLSHQASPPSDSLPLPQFCV